MLKKIYMYLRKLFGRHPDEMTYLQGQGLRIGNHFRNHSPYAFDALFPWLISIGDNVCISANVKLLAHDTSTEYVNGHTKIGIIDIGDNVYIGYGATILCNVRIGSNCVIGAGSVVTRDVPSGTVYEGNPARYICSIEEYKEKHSKSLEQVPVYEGPCLKWHELPASEKAAMREALNNTYGYMK